MLALGLVLTLNVCHQMGAKNLFFLDLVPIPVGCIAP